MAYDIKVYRIGRRRLKRALLEGFAIQEDGSLRTEGNTLRRQLFLRQIDSGADDCPWGRLAFDARLTGEVVMTVRVFAADHPVFVSNGEFVEIDAYLLDPTREIQQKDQLVSAAGGLRKAGSSDLLLYGLRGRYLWIWIEVQGSGSAVLDNFRVITPGDNFYQTFPEVYRTPDNDFFRRYLSVFSSLFLDLQERVDHLETFLNLDTAPAQALPVMAGWLGLELEGSFLKEAELRRLLKAMPELIRTKGTRRAVERIVGIFTDSPVYLVEQNLLDGTAVEDKGLYGASAHDFAVLIGCADDERLRAVLRYLINQFKPLRSQAALIFLGGRGGMDDFTYLDLNGVTPSDTAGQLDTGGALMGTQYLQ